MKVKNKFFFINTNDTNLEAIVDYCVENMITLRPNLATTRYVIKLPIGAQKPSLMQHLTKMNHNRVIKELAKPEWTLNNI